MGNQDSKSQRAVLDGLVITWGSRACGELGHSALPQESMVDPGVVEGALKTHQIGQIAAGGRQCLAVDKSGTQVFSWGDICAGHLGSDALAVAPANFNPHSPVNIKAFEPILKNGKIVLQIACGEKHCAVVTQDGLLFTWGEGSFGRLGHNSVASVRSPKLVHSLRSTRIIRVACGDFHTLAVGMPWDTQALGRQWRPSESMELEYSVQRPVLFAWGLGRNGRLGLGHEKDAWTPTVVFVCKDGGEAGDRDGAAYWSVQYLACGGHHSAAIVNDGTLVTWGGGAFGKLGHGDFDDRLVPTWVEAFMGRKVERVALGTHHSAAVINGGKLWTWGRGGRLGHEADAEDDAPYPRCLDLPAKFSEVACGTVQTVAISAEEGVWAWGSVRKAAHGGAENKRANQPCLMRGSIRAVAAACGVAHCAILVNNGDDP